MNINLKITLYTLLTLFIFSCVTFGTYYIIKSRTDTKQPHIIIMEGGLGNQMFQYAFAKALEKNSGRKVLFNTDIYNKDKRNYALGIFKLNNRFASMLNMNNTANYVKEKNPFLYEKELFNIETPTKFKGYFQNELYFKQISSKLKRDFKFPKLKKTDSFNKYWIKEIKKAQNPVFIHIRRDDYLPLKWELPTSYYFDAIKYIEEHVKNPTYFVFGLNSEEFLKKELKLDIPYFVIDDTNNTNNQDWKDMMLMSKCKHAIIANSTFSWWAAWLGPNQNKGIVVAPSPFVLGQDEVICENWVKIKR